MEQIVIITIRTNGFLNKKLVRIYKFLERGKSEKIKIDIEKNIARL